jgi:hypothetical protein
VRGWEDWKMRGWEDRKLKAERSKLKEKIHHRGQLGR